MANTINYAQLFQDGLDTVLAQELTTGWAELNADRVKYNGGNEVKIAKLGLDELDDYNRATGYVAGNVTLTWETHTFQYDRGRKFTLDAMDVDESNFTATAGNVMGEFVRTISVPEVDLIRIAGMAQKAGNKVRVDGDEKDALEEFKAGIVAVRDAGYAGQLVAHVTYAFLNELELKFAGQLSEVTFAVAGIDTTFKTIDGVALIPTTSDRMHTKVKKTSGKIEADGNELAFLIAGKDIPIAVAKHNPVRTFTPEQNQTADAYVLNYRIYHDIWVEDNKVDALYAGYVGVLA